MFNLESIQKFKLLHAHTGIYTSSSLHIDKNNPPNLQLTELITWKKWPSIIKLIFLLIKLKYGSTLPLTFHKIIRRDSFTTGAGCNF